MQRTGDTEGHNIETQLKFSQDPSHDFELRERRYNKVKKQKRKTGQHEAPHMNVTLNSSDLANGSKMEQELHGKD